MWVNLCRLWVYICGAERNVVIGSAYAKLIPPALGLGDCCCHSGAFSHYVWIFNNDRLRCSLRTSYLH